MLSALSMKYFDTLHPEMQPQPLPLPFQDRATHWSPTFFLPLEAYQGQYGPEKNMS